MLCLFVVFHNYTFGWITKNRFFRGLLFLMKQFVVLYICKIRIPVILHVLFSVIILLVIILIRVFPEIKFLQIFQNKSHLWLCSHVTPVFTGIRRDMENTAGSSPQSNGFAEKLKAWLSWSWTYVCFIWFGMVMIMIYVLWSPLKLQETLASGE